LQDVLVSAYGAGTSVLIDDGRSGQVGGYMLNVTQSTVVDVFAELDGPGWFVLDGSNPGGVEPGSFGVPIAPLAYAGNPVTSPATGIDLQFNSTPTEKLTAFVNAHRQMSRAWRWVAPPNSVPVAPVVAHAVGGVPACNAVFANPGPSTRTRRAICASVTGSRAGPETIAPTPPTQPLLPTSMGISFNTICSS
jgi:hypothetical protein